MHYVSFGIHTEVKKRCQALLDKLIETNDSVRKAHQEYLERGFKWDIKV